MLSQFEQDIKHSTASLLSAQNMNRTQLLEMRGDKFTATLQAFLDSYTPDSLNQWVQSATLASLLLSDRKIRIFIFSDKAS